MPAIADEAIKLSPQIRVLGTPNQIASYSAARVNHYFEQVDLIAKEAYEQAPVIFAIEGKRVMAGQGDTVFVSGFQQKDDATNENGPLFSVIRLHEPLRDLKTKKILAYKTEVKGVAHLVQAGDTSIFMMKSSRKEVELGDRIVPKTKAIRQALTPKRLERPVLTSILSVMGGVKNIALDDLVLLRAGQRQGLQPADLLGVYQGASRHQHEESEPVSLIGKVMILRPYEQLSLAVIVEESDYLLVGDAVSNF